MLLNAKKKRRLKGKVIMQQNSSVIFVVSKKHTCFFSSAQMPGTNLNRRYPNISLLSLAYVNKAATLNIEKSIEHRMSTACLLEVLICSDYYGNG